ncbi:hypothetical protein MSG28_007135 [Choristoneura fumiferana]|uniref:Uncharacterized protein n=1 Tax=Choristoneura fumiferana TaxID=7141 RepID=A0ACC0JMJ8_CHOFU|nr:hypothetical protein MSG28_007135 [Choristoneura fumiferana]
MIINSDQYISTANLENFPDRAEEKIPLDGKIRDLGPKDDSLVLLKLKKKDNEDKNSSNLTSVPDEKDLRNAKKHVKKEINEGGQNNGILGSAGEILRKISSGKKLELVLSPEHS